MWFDGNIVHITASDWLPYRAPQKVQNNVYVVVYPIGWQQLGLATPQCDPCDHAGNGIGFDDFHDHVLDSVPGVVGIYRPQARKRDLTELFIPLGRQ